MIIKRSKLDALCIIILSSNFHFQYLANISVSITVFHSVSVVGVVVLLIPGKNGDVVLVICLCNALEDTAMCDLGVFPLGDLGILVVIKDVVSPSLVLGDFIVV